MDFYFTLERNKWRNGSKGGKKPCDLHRYNILERPLSDVYVAFSIPIFSELENYECDGGAIQSELEGTWVEHFKNNPQSKR